MLGREARPNLAVFVALAFLAVVARGSADVSGGPVDDPQLIAAAKKEGTVVFYGVLTQTQLSAIAQRFEATYGIKVQMLRMESTSLPSRVITEERSKPGSIDVVSDGGFQIDALKRLGVLGQYRPPEDAALLAGTYDRDGYWSSVLVNTEVIAFNPARIKAAGIKPPRTWEDLAQSQWHGRFGLFVGSYEWYAAMKNARGTKETDELLRAYAANKPTMFGSKASGMRMIASGDILAAPNVYGYDALTDRRRGESIDFVNPTPTFIELYPVAIVAHAPHPNAARLIVRWWLSRETQVWQRDTLGRLSARKDVKNDPELLNPKVRYVVNDPSLGASYNDDVRAFNAIFGIPG